MRRQLSICTILFFGYISKCCICASTTVSGAAPNVTGLTPDFSIFRTTTLYGTSINVSLTVYQRPVNGTMKETLQIIDGNTNINSTNYCIAYGVTFKFLGQYPITNSTITGNGGCDAILGKQCSDNIRTSLQQSFKSITEVACGVNLDALFKIPQGCTNNNANNAFVSSVFLNNGSFFMNTSSASNSTIPWLYESTPTTTDDYNELMKYFVLVYFVGRPYSSGIIDSAIACLSDYTKIVEPTNNQTTTRPNNYATSIFNNKIHFIFLVFSYFIIVSFL